MAENDVAVITGAGTGMGAACAESLAAVGFSVVLAGRRADKLEETKARILESSPGAAVVVRVTDVAVPAECEALIADAVDELGKVDVVVTAAANFEPAHSYDMTAELWDGCLDVTLRGSVLVAVAAAKRMRDAGGGRIVLFSSVNSHGSEPETAHYSAAKAAINSAAKSLAVDFAGDGIVVNAVSPGWVETPLIAEFVAEATEEDLKRVNPLARLGEPEELASVVTYLATDAPGFLTGATLFVDGGQTAIAPVP